MASVQPGYIMAANPDAIEADRLAGLEALYDPITVAVLEGLGVAPGWTVLDAGAGHGSIARWLAERVGPGGRVHAVDLDLRFLVDLPAHVVVRRADVEGASLLTDDADGFDLVHARMLLANLTAPEAATDRLAEAVRPAGWLVVEEPVWLLTPDAAARWPSTRRPLLVEIARAWHALMDAAHLDAFAGLAGPARLRSRGFDEVGLRLRSDGVFGDGLGARPPRDARAVRTTRGGGRARRRRAGHRVPRGVRRPRRGPRLRGPRLRMGPPSGDGPVSIAGSRSDVLRFGDRVAIVTGGGGGLGRQHALLLASRGAAVVVNDIGGVDAAGERALGDATAVAAEITAAGGRAIAVIGSIAEEAGATIVVERALAAFGRIDIVVNNAGILRSRDFAEMTAALWDEVQAVNVRGAFLVTRAAWNPMREHGHGRVVFTTSNSGLLGVPGSSAYAASKAALWGLTRVLALEGAEHGIRVNAIAPIAFTGMSAQSRAVPPAWRDGSGDEWAVRLDPARIAPVVAWLCHDQCELTGEVLGVAGGRVARFFLGLTPGWVSDALDARAGAGPPRADPAGTWLRRAPPGVRRGPSAPAAPAVVTPATGLSAVLAPRLDGVVDSVRPDGTVRRAWA